MNFLKNLNAKKKLTGRFAKLSQEVGGGRDKNI
jgi:hypothetical protein